MYLLHSWGRLKAETNITKGYERSPSAWGWERITKGYMPGLEALEGFLLTTCFWEQGLLFHDKTPFRVSPKLCYGLGGGNCILCLNALMFIWNGYMQVCLMLCSLKIIKLHNWIIKLCQSTRGCPWVSFSECGSPSLTITFLLSHKKNKIIPFTAMWMDLEIVKVGEVSQTQKGKYHMIFLICRI